MAEGLTESFVSYLSSVYVIAAKLGEAMKIARFLPSTSTVFILSRKVLRQLLATVVMSVQCCVKDSYMDGLGNF